MARRAILAAVLALMLAPSALANDFFVVNAADNTIDVYSPTGTPLTSFGGSGTGPGQLNGASGIGSHPNVAYIYVADRVNCQIDVFRLDGTFSHSLGSPGTGAGQLQFPRDVAVASDGTAYVADGGNNRVQIYSPIGADAGSFSTGPSSTPFRITIGPDGNVYVSLHGVNVTPGADDRIAVFTPAGTPVDSIGTGGTGDGQLNNPGGIDFNPVGDRIRVADTNNNRVQEFDSDGDFVSKLGTAGAGAGAGQFSFPAGIVFDPVADRLFVADRGNNRIQAFNSASTFVSEFPAEAPTDLALAALGPACTADLEVLDFKFIASGFFDGFTSAFDTPRTALATEGHYTAVATVRNRGTDNVAVSLGLAGAISRFEPLARELSSGEMREVRTSFVVSRTAGEVSYRATANIVFPHPCDDPDPSNSFRDLRVTVSDFQESRLAKLPSSIIAGKPGSIPVSVPRPGSSPRVGARSLNDVVKVELAVVRLQGRVKAPRVAPACFWLKNARAAFKRMQPVNGACNKPIWLRMTKAKATKWLFKLRKGLPNGKYVVYSRTTNRAGLTEENFVAGKNRRAFTVRRP